MKVLVKARYKNEITPSVIGAILMRLGLSPDFTVEYSLGDGRNIIIEVGPQKRIYVIVSRENADARNAFLAQYIPTVLRAYIDDRTANKEIYAYLSDVSDRAKTAFIVDTYRVAKALGIGILNESDLGLGEIKPYDTFSEWKKAKTSRRNYNRANNSSYAIEDDDEIVVYGKLFGANGKEAVFLACQLAQIAKKTGKTVVFVQVKEQDTETVSENDKRVLQYYGVVIESGEIVVTDDRRRVSKSTCRSQYEFRYNLLEKYGGKKCYLCDCDIDRMIIASHIHRIVDIDRSPLPKAEKHRQAVDGDNGFWLCANHDKLFEYGIVTFDVDGDLLVTEDISKTQADYIKKITTTTKIQPCHLNPELAGYLTLHNRRVGLGKTSH